MKHLTYVIIGGGHAGILAVHSILKEFKGRITMQQVRIILIDRQPYHVRKVLLFKPAAGGDEITMPLAQMFPHYVQVIQGSVTKIVGNRKQVRYEDAQGVEQTIDYDALVVAVGSVVKQPDSSHGGIALTSIVDGLNIREQWRKNLHKAASETNVKERQRLMTVAVTGAGISGIETSAELAYVMREEAKALQLDPDAIRIYLLNSGVRLFDEGPAKVGHKLEAALHEYGVKVLHRVKVLHEKEGQLALADGVTLSVGLCIWTIGLQPNPILRSFGLPLTPEGEVIVDHSYRVEGMQGVYSIGDCARIVDAANGQADRKTCKEASAQAIRLGKVMLADVEGRPAPNHRRMFDFYCFGIGPKRGIVWTRQWGMDIVITGKLGWSLRKYTWDLASAVKQKF